MLESGACEAGGQAAGPAETVFYPDGPACEKGVRTALQTAACCTQHDAHLRAVSTRVGDASFLLLRQLLPGRGRPRFLGEADGPDGRPGSGGGGSSVRSDFRVNTFPAASPGSQTPDTCRRALTCSRSGCVPSARVLKAPSLLL